MRRSVPDGSIPTSDHLLFCLIKINCNDNELPNLIFSVLVCEVVTSWKELVKPPIFLQATENRDTAQCL